jgi:hypothetical protein
LLIAIPTTVLQALHIVPYPPRGEEENKASIDAAHMEQVHNSYFNGYILGYPLRFVETYCNDLPNELTEGQVRSALSKAKAEVAHLIKEGTLQKAQLRIRLNRTEPISVEKWNYIKSKVSSNIVEVTSWW